MHVVGGVRSKWYSALMPASNAGLQADDIAIRLVTVDRCVSSLLRVHARRAPRKPDLGNLDRRSCVLRSLSAVSSCPDETAESSARSVLPAGDIKRRGRR